MWPTCVAVPAAYRLALSVRGRDYELPGGAAGGPGVRQLRVFTGPFRHNELGDRPTGLFGGDVTLHCGPRHQAYLLLPIVPPV